MDRLTPSGHWGVRRSPRWSASQVGISGHVASRARLLSPNCGRYFASRGGDPIHLSHLAENVGLFRDSFRAFLLAKRAVGLAFASSAFFAAESGRAWMFCPSLDCPGGCSLLPTEWGINLPNMSYAAVCVVPKSGRFGYCFIGMECSPYPTPTHPQWDASGLASGFLQGRFDTRTAATLRTRVFAIDRHNIWEVS